MSKTCAICRQPATREICEEEPFAQRICEECFQAIMDRRGFAAGPWQPMDTPPPEGERLLVKLQFEDDETGTYVATNISPCDLCPGGEWQIHPDDEDQLEEYPIVAWARLNK